MPKSLQEISTEIQDESERARRQLSILRGRVGGRLGPLRELLATRTEAFLELARHYLPDLSHRSLDQAWVEVRDDLRHLLLLKNDRMRQLNDELAAVGQQLGERRRHRDDLRGQLEKARLDLASRTGNFQKALRETESVTRCLDQIDSVDEEIACGIAALEHAEKDAREKLPAYEASSLFAYLRDCRYGTESYTGDGMQRRWDRWVAKLIGYEQAKSSYDYLSQTPDHLRALVDEKRNRYQALLRELDVAQREAMATFGVTSQQRLWKTLATSLEHAERDFDAVKAHHDRLSAERETVDSIQGPLYLQAVQRYLEFLTELQPETRRVYAECTRSPVDDEIVARLQQIESEIDSIETASQESHQEVTDLRIYISGLDELSQRIANHQRHHAPECQLERFPVASHLGKLRDRQSTPAQIWRALRAAVAPMRSSDSFRTTGPLDASLQASASRVQPSVRPTDFDPLDVVLVPPTEEQELPSAVTTETNGGFTATQFRMLAYCRNKRDALAITSLLNAHMVPCFFHDTCVGRATDGRRLRTSDEFIVMAARPHLTQARAVIEQLQSSAEAPWQCGHCEVDIIAGYALCWQCGSDAGRPDGAMTR